MQRKELVSLLAMLAKQRRITIEQARAFLAHFDAGEVQATALPLPLADQSRLDEAAVIAALLLLARAGVAWETMQRLDVRREWRDVFREGFDRAVGRQATVLVDTQDVWAWQLKMRRLIRQHLVQMYAIGTGEPLPAADVLAAVQEEAATQDAYLYRFAAELAVLAGLGATASERGIAARSRQYGGAGYALYWLGESMEYSGRSGWIVHYDAQDDGSTCSPCSTAASNGPYLSGQAPFPGEICRGRGSCRCRLRFEYAPEIAAGLENRAVRYDIATLGRRPERGTPLLQTEPTR